MKFFEHRGRRQGCKILSVIKKDNDALGGKFLLLSPYFAPWSRSIGQRIMCDLFPKLCNTSLIKRSVRVSYVPV